MWRGFGSRGSFHNKGKGYCTSETGKELNVGHLDMSNLYIKNQVCLVFVFAPGVN